MKDTRKYMTEGEITPDDMAGEVARLREGAKLPEAGWRLADGSPRTLSQLAESWRESQNEEYPEDRRCFADWLEGEIQEFPRLRTGVPCGEGGACGHVFRGCGDEGPGGSGRGGVGIVVREASG